MQILTRIFRSAEYSMSILFPLDKRILVLLSLIKVIFYTALVWSQNIHTCVWTLWKHAQVIRGYSQMTSTFFFVFDFFYACNCFNVLIWKTERKGTFYFFKISYRNCPLFCHLWIAFICFITYENKQAILLTCLVFNWGPIQCIVSPKKCTTSRINSDLEEKLSRVENASK